ncbi:MAG: PEGA domain protein [Methanoregula sp. PtaU1.Bin051]|nr:MAG: PEGA domain protein [Methanoregula sp. PtaU1.Bin051]
MNPHLHDPSHPRLELILITCMLVLLALVPAATAVDNGFIAVSSTPAGARIYVDGAYQATTPWKGIFPPGSHSLKLTYQNYADYETTFILHPLESKNFNVQMSPLAFFSFSSNPVGAKVYINGVWEGNTNMEVAPVPLGSSYTVKIVKDGYQPYETSVVIHEDTHIHAELVPIAATGTLAVMSNPAEARVLVDGIMVGLTPYSGTTIAGEHTVKVSKINYEDYTTTVTVEGGKTTTVTATLVPSGKPATGTGSVSVISTPVGANVYIDGVYYGPAPVSADLAAASHSIKVSMPGYSDFVSTVSITAGQSLPVYVTLVQGTSTVAVTQALSSIATIGTGTQAPQEGLGSVYLSSRPASAKAYLDGVFMGMTPLGIRSVSAGTHQVLFTYPGYDDYAAAITVKAGETTEFAAPMVVTGMQTNRAPGFGWVAALTGIAAIIALFRRAI